MTAKIEPQIKVPPTYLTKLWDLIKQDITAAENLPNVKTDAQTGNAPGKHQPEWQQFSNFAQAIDAEYSTGIGSYKWEYTFDFDWNSANTKRDERDDGDDTSGLGLACPVQTTSDLLTTSTVDTSPTVSQPVTSTPETTKSATETSSVVISSTTSEPTTSTESTSSSSATPSTTPPPRVAAPDITIATPTKKPECVQGYATYTLPAVASAPANAASLKFLIPAADAPGTNWEFEIGPGFIIDPKTNIESWEVGTSADEPTVASGKGGSDMKIEWKAPSGASDTYVQLTFTEPDPPLGIQTYGITAKGSYACLTDSCSGPPKITTSPDGMVCKLYPCSTQPVCEGGGPITPEARCEVWDYPLWYKVEIWTNDFTAGDNGEGLKKEEKGCGAMTAWKVEEITEGGQPSADGDWTATRHYSFTLPWTVKAGCVERAIASAGGPSGLQCDSFNRRV
ncbi:hypothetical protein F5Y17DRAFT_453111 [Xylariaceae sp. FL0594]|nr:hypothetical protein F5Y17DRAFT_453111 [Xylariaceae sp. FL0594]